MMPVTQQKAIDAAAAALAQLAVEQMRAEQDAPPRPMSDGARAQAIGLAVHRAWDLAKEHLGPAQRDTWAAFVDAVEAFCEVEASK
jgi:hypothetical protein